MNKDRSMKEMIENVKDKVQSLFLDIIRNSEFERLNICTPIYIRNFDRRITLREHETIINRNMLRELTFPEFFRDIRNPEFLGKLSGRSLYLRGSGIGGRGGYGIFSGNGWLHEEGLSEKSGDGFGDHIKVYVDPGDGKQFVSVKMDWNNRHVFILSGRKENSNAELVDSVVGRRKFPGFEGIESQRGWMPDRESRFSRILRRI